ncbi:MAG: nucleoside hydrolase [Aquificae bacterium]|nr:nucleoside hydrolase [Aquificota bacterium]
MKLVISMETWDIDDTLMLLFLLHYREKGLVDILGVHVDRGTPRQNAYVGYILKKAGADVPIFSKNVSPNSDSIPEYYRELFEDLPGEEKKALPLSELVSRLRGEEFYLIAGASLTLPALLLREDLLPKLVVVQGGFAGRSLTGKPNEKFGERDFAPTFNFNKEPKATDEFLSLALRKGVPTLLVSKNVNHLILISKKDLPPKAGGNLTKPKELYLRILERYLSLVRPKKSLHDVYASLALFDRGIFRWERVIPVRKEGGRFPEWGSVRADTSISITVGADEKLVKDYTLFVREFQSS